MKIFASIIMESDFLSKAPLNVYDILNMYPSSTLKTNMNGLRAREMVYEVEESGFNEIVKLLDEAGYLFKSVLHSGDGKDNVIVEHGVQRYTEPKSKRKELSGVIKKKVIQELLNEADKSGLTQESLNILFVKLNKLM